MLGLDDLVIEMMTELDKVELMAEGLAKEQNIVLQSLDDETLLESLRAMIKEEELISQQEEIYSKASKGHTMVSPEKYNLIFEELRKEKNSLNEELFRIQMADKSEILEEVRKHKSEILKNALLSSAQVIEKMHSVTKRDIDRIYSLSLKIQCRKALLSAIDKI